MGYGAFYVICPRASSQYVTPLLRDPVLSSSNFQATTQDVLLQPLLSTLSAVEMLHDSALYKCTIDIDIDIRTRNKSIVPSRTMHTGRIWCQSTETGVTYYVNNTHA